MRDRQLECELLLQAGRLLLEYNESTAEIHRALAATAKSLSLADCQVAVSYGGIAVTLAGGNPAMQTARALRYNSAVQTRVHGILEQVRGGKLDAPAALARVATVEAETQKVAPWLAALVLGAAAASLAGLLGADGGTAKKSSNRTAPSRAEWIGARSTRARRRGPTRRVPAGTAQTGRRLIA